MKKTVTLGVLLLGLFATSVQAKTKYCHTIEDCRQQISERKADLAKLLKNVTPELTRILTTGVSHLQAQAFCEDRDMRLPTARELALVAQDMGAVGISETRKDGYYLIKGMDTAGNPDDFYFNARGYRRPAGDLGNYWFWSSSVTDRGGVYVLAGYNGVMFDVFAGYNELIFDVHGNEEHSTVAVRCVLSR